MTTQQLKQEVIKEAYNLKKYAEIYEIDRLSFKELDSDDVNLCIYGQMTGWCFSERADELLSNCAVLISYSVHEINTDGIALFRKFSAIEIYINMIRDGNENLINFLKGNKEQLTIYDL